MGHLNVAGYVGAFDNATWHLFAAVGMGPTWLRENARGMAAVEQTLRYTREALAGDLLRVTSTVLAISNRTLRFRHVMVNAEDGGELATCEIVAAHLDTARRVAVPLPEAVRAAVKERFGVG
ncbi:MAG: thioesterase family protein [Alphaproteobacteria bacterium]|nr:thioesterase family protein [Alphaproteobacteria bacterium]